MTLIGFRDNRSPGVHEAKMAGNHYFMLLCNATECFVSGNANY